MTEVTSDDDTYVLCAICRHQVDTTMVGHGRLPSGEFCHVLCHKHGEPPDSLEKTYDPVRPHVVHLYNCGHDLYAPPQVAPETCPECSTPKVHVDEQEDRVD